VVRLGTYKNTQQESNDADKSTNDSADCNDISANHYGVGVAVGVRQLIP